MVLFTIKLMVLRWDLHWPQFLTIYSWGFMKPNGYLNTKGRPPHFIEDTWTIFLLFSKMKNKRLHFFDYLNSRHPNIKFTNEYGENSILPFLNISICNLNTFETSVYHKTTYTRLLLNFKSFAPLNINYDLLRTF